MLLNRLLVAAIGIPIVIYLIFIGELSTFIALDLCILIMMLEFYRMLEKSHIPINRRSGIVASVIMPAVYYIQPANTNNILLFCISFLIIFFITKRVILGRIKESVGNISYTIFGIMYISFLFSHLLMIRNISDPINFMGIETTLGKAWLTMVFIYSFGSDSVAFFVGKLFGRTQLAPKVSPKKTVEGFIGATIFGLLISIFVSKTFYFSILKSILLSISATTISQIGDLGASLFKREFDVKDTSRILMSHGGLIDRCDSTLFVAPFIFYFIKFFGIRG